MTIAKDISVELSNRLKKIKIADGFETDVGVTSFRGRRRLGETDMPCSVVIERPDEPEKQQTNQVKVKHRYVLEGHAVCDPNNPNDTGHQIIGDIKKAIFTGNLNLDGKLTTSGRKALELAYEGSGIAPREDGMNMVSVSVEVSVTYVEDLSNP